MYAQNVLDVMKAKVRKRAIQHSIVAPMENGMGAHRTVLPHLKAANFAQFSGVRHFKTTWRSLK